MRAVLNILILIHFPLVAFAELPVENLFFHWQSPGLSAPAPILDYKLLIDSEEAFLSKVELLLGYRPSLDLIRQKDPSVILDFQHAPKFDRIYLSTLLFRRDFSGVILARILEWHAHQGTPVFVISTGYMEDKNDSLWLNQIAQRETNFHLSQYRFNLKKKSKLVSFLGQLNPVQDVKNYLKNMHVKLLVTESKSDPQLNVVVTGGRNVHDGFLFSENPVFPNHPELDQLKPTDSYAYWQDFDIKMISPALVNVAIHQLQVLNSMASQQNDGFNQSVVDSESDTGSGNLLARQFLSIPYLDQHALEKLYVDLIDSARESIVISSPYLMPMPNIRKAIDRAVGRQVEIQIQTRINLQGDTQAWLYEETNKSAINELYQKTKIFEWTRPSILHTKMMIIDQKVAVVGSVNLSHRSFVEDVEGITLLHGDALVEDLSKLQDTYHAQSRRIREAQSRKLIPELIVHELSDEF